jgi:hypothetical protein
MEVPMTATKKIPTETRREIEVRAYLIWEREGRPQGRQHEHWRMAEAEILGTLPAKKTAKAKTAKATNGTAPKAAAKTAPKPKIGKAAVKPKAPKA